MYNQTVESARLDEAFTLSERWNDLVKEAKMRDFKLAKTKQKFANVT